MTTPSRPDHAYLQALYEETVLRNPWICNVIMPDGKPLRPTDKQFELLYLTTEPEILYGGACGGGKSAAMLMAALQFVQMPGYSAIILRRTLAELEGAGALIAKSHEWLRPTAANWNDRKKTWTFPSGATLSFGYLESPGDKYRYQGTEFNFCGVDECTNIAEEDYRYMWSRLRRLAGTEVPIRMRASGNPGGKSHQFFKQRFFEEGRKFGRIFIPARLEDNPYLDREEYIKSLNELDPITRAQYLAGDWTVRQAGSIFRREWFKVVEAVPARLIQVRAWDLAASLKKKADFTVGGLMGREQKTGEEYVLDVRRAKVNPQGVNDLILQTATIDTPAVHIYLPLEPGDAGLHLQQNFVKLLSGFPLHFYGESGSGDKLTRAQPFASYAGAGRVSMYKGDWITQVLDELESFGISGHDDVVDSLSRAHQFLSMSCYGEMPTKQPKQPSRSPRLEDRRRALGENSRQRARGFFGRY